MLIVYILFLSIATFFKVMHWPGAGILFAATPFIAAGDLLIQILKKGSNKELRILGAIAVLFFSIYLTFRFLHWPGHSVQWTIALLVGFIYILRFFMKKPGMSLRTFLTMLLLAFVVLNGAMKTTQFRLFYLREDPFNSKEQIPTFFVYSLARDFYLEGNNEKALQLLNRNENFYLEQEKSPSKEDFLLKIYERNRVINQQAIESVKSGQWNYYVQLEPEI